MKADLSTLLLFTAVFSLGCVLALVLRGRLRRAAGAGAAYALWSLPPLMLLGLALPAPSAVAWPIPAAGGLHAVVLPLDLGGATRWPGTAWLLPWLAGALTCLGWQLWRQQRFVRALGPLQRIAHPRLPLYRAAHGVGLPAVVGLLRPRIVLPPDFEQRYAAAQRSLLLHHEDVHRRRGDLPCNALATVLLCLQWFNPLAHVALAAFRRDQEMACDARVLARRPRQRRAYAEAMLIGAGVGSPPPLGCPWPSRHPLKERIEMLKLPAPHLRRRRAAGVFIGLLAMGGACAAWAAQPAAKPADLPLAERNQAVTSTLPPPRYPKTAYDQNLSGQVMLLVDVRADGSVSNVAVESSRPAGVFDAATVEAARQWRFRPEIKGGKPVAGQVRVPVTFEINPPATPPTPGGTALAQR